MRFAPILVSFFLLVLSVAHGQQQEQGFISRMRRDDKNEVFNLSKVAPASSRTFSSHGAANVKSFAFDQKFTPKEFNARTFSGTKSSWMGDFKYSTKAADTKTYATKEAPTKPLPVKDASESGKLLPTKDYPGQRAYLKHGPRDHFLDRKVYAPGTEPAGWTGDLHEMSVEDIRKLLNKSK